MIHFWRYDPRSRGWSTYRWRYWSTHEEMIFALLRVWSTFEEIFHCIGNDDPLRREWSGPLRRWSTDPPMRCVQDHWGWPTVCDNQHVFEVGILLWDYMFLRWGYCYGTLVRLHIWCTALPKSTITPAVKSCSVALVLYSWLCHANLTASFPLFSTYKIIQLLLECALCSKHNHGPSTHCKKVKFGWSILFRCRLIFRAR
jgi:hypothetical protein